MTAVVVTVALIGVALNVLAWWHVSLVVGAIAKQVGVPFGTEVREMVTGAEQRVRLIVREEIAARETQIVGSIVTTHISGDGRVIAWVQEACSQAAKSERADERSERWRRKPCS